MRVLITGGTGTIGEAIIKELRCAGHAVTGISRSEASDAKLWALGATPHRGLLDQPASYQSAAVAHNARASCSAEGMAAVDGGPGDVAVPSLVSR